MRNQKIQIDQEVDHTNRKRNLENVLNIKIANKKFVNIFQRNIKISTKYFNASKGIIKLRST